MSNFTFQRNINNLQSSLSISYWNVQGYHERKFQDNDFIDNITQHDIIGIGETWLTEQSKHTLHIPGYYDYSVVRKKKKTERWSLTFGKKYN